jgi:S1-C subfamily serine protease
VGKLSGFLVAVGLVAIAGATAVYADDPDDAKVRRSVVKIFATVRRPDVSRPWTKHGPQEVSGSGVVIAGKRILTNAHVVNYASQVLIKPDKSSDKLSAKIEALASGIDLAVLKLDDDSFFDAHPPLPASKRLPSLQQTALAYGYPDGGTELSITKGIVSRVEFAYYDTWSEGIRQQCSADIAPVWNQGKAKAK